MSAYALEKFVGRGLSFDDVLVVPEFSDTLPKDVDVTSVLTPTIALGIPIVSAAMDTVTESPLAIALARVGGIGFVHKNLTPEAQAYEVRRVKRSQAGRIDHPVTANPGMTVADLAEHRAEGISGFPIVDNGRLIGIVTNRDLRFADSSAKLGDLMTSGEALITITPNTSLVEARQILHEHRIEKLPIVDGGELVGLITVKDLLKSGDYPNACRDEQGRLRVGGAISTGADALDRVHALVAAGVDVIAIDSAHGFSQGVIGLVGKLRQEFPDLQIVAGNVATADGTEALIDAGASAIKVGMGPGSICTTRVVAGCGVPQITAILDCCEVAIERGVPVIADGGIRYSGDITKAIAAGASCVMIGSLFAGTEESPGERFLYEGRTYKIHRGMGSEAAMRAGGADRYGQSGATKYVSEGVESRAPYRGTLDEMVFQLVGGLRQGMGYAGARTIGELRGARFLEITGAGLNESHPHNVAVMHHEKNYPGREGR